MKLVLLMVAQMDGNSVGRMVVMQVDKKERSKAAHMVVWMVALLVGMMDCCKVACLEN